MVQRKHKPGQEIRRVAQFDWRIIDHDCKKPFVASGLEFIPLPVSFLSYFFSIVVLLPYYAYSIIYKFCFMVQVMHGEDYVCLGFLFGKNYKVAYISDVSRILPDTEHCEYITFLHLHFIAIYHFVESWQLFVCYALSSGTQDFLSLYIYIRLAKLYISTISFQQPIKSANVTC